MNILLVGKFKKLYKEHLEENGFKVLTAEDGAEAWEMILQNMHTKRIDEEIKWVVSRIILDKKDGIELLANIRQQFPIRFIALTDVDGEITRDKLKEHGADGHLIIDKTDPEALTEAITTMDGKPSRPWVENSPGKKKNTESKTKFFLADKPINEFLYRFDLKPEYKQYVTTLYEGQLMLPEEEKADLTEEQMNKIIETSRTSSESFWVVAIEHKGKLVVADGIKILSDGKVEVFVDK
jgi:CheY-like chemotaxis protein